MQADLGEGIAHGYRACRKICRLQQSLQIGRLKMIQPDSFVRLSGPEALGEFVQSGGNEILGLNVEGQPPAQMNPETMRDQNVMNQASQFGIARRHRMFQDRGNHEGVGVRLMTKQLPKNRNHEQSL